MADATNIAFLKEKIDGLNKRAWELRVNDSTQAHALSKEAIDIAEEIDYTKGKAESYRTFAFCLIRLSKHNEAIEYCNKSLPLFELLNDLDGQSSVNGYYGIIQRGLGNYAASLEFLFKFSELAQETGNKEAEALSYYHLGVTYKYLGDYETALNYLLKGLSISQPETITYWVSKSYTLKQIGLIYFETGDFTNAIDYCHQSLSLAKEAGDKWGEAGCLDSIGNIHFKLEQFDEAIKFYNTSLEITGIIEDKKGHGNALYHLAQIYLKKKDTAKALGYAEKSLRLREEAGDKKGQAEVILCIAKIAGAELPGENTGKKELGFLKKALLLGTETKALDLLCNIHDSFYHTYKKLHQYSKALQHLEKFYELEKEVHSNALKQKIINLETTHRVEQTRKESEILRLRNIELSGFYEEIKKQKEKVDITLSELKSTQAQLIQSEKMASLGELTAGIAHEIQNPLNFVNNFSEINAELIDELHQEIDKGNLDEVKTIANDIKENEQKINHHGKRADAIVKGMLQHSRSSSAVKEPIDINALADEYIRLCYHGLRAKDKAFNATINTDFDSSLEKINMIPQDIGRVLLNLLTNAFYAVNEKKKTSHAGNNGEPENEAGYDPTVFVSTKKIGDKVEIRVADNGNGISQKVLDKVFQPFFTTKPTGQGTGLGLSLSYDIVKAHSGEIQLETKEGKGAAFIVVLPLK